jgi:hypothetical protein
MKNVPLGICSCCVAALVWFGSCGGIVAVTSSSAAMGGLTKTSSTPIRGRRIKGTSFAHHGPTMPLAIRVTYSSDKPSGSWLFVKCVDWRR